MSDLMSKNDNDQTGKGPRRLWSIPDAVLVELFKIGVIIFQAVADSD